VNISHCYYFHCIGKPLFSIGSLNLWTEQVAFQRDPVIVKDWTIE
jgi:hypothetical protein